MATLKSNVNYECLTCKHTGKAFCSLEIDDKIVFSETKKNILLKKGEIIFKENNFPTGVYAIYSGKIKISKLGEEGKEQIVRFAKSGDIIGYRSILSEDYYHATATALSDVKLCHIPKKSFLESLKNNYRLNKFILKRLASDLKKAEKKILSISQKTVKERIAETLILLHHEFGSRLNDSIDVKLSRKEIGNIAGSTIETTIRTLSEFKKDGIIKFEGKEIIVVDIAKLINIANVHTVLH